MKEKTELTLQQQPIKQSSPTIKPPKGFTLDYLDHNQREKIVNHLKTGKTLKCHHPKCQSFIENEEFSTLYEYNVHCHTSHRNSPLHPELSLIELLKLEPVGNPWEPDSSSVIIIENTSTNHSKNLKEEVSKGLDFLLYHFNQDRLFPRFITTNKLNGKQIEVFSKEEALNHFEESNFIDCRVNAFPSYTKYKDIQRYPPDFIFIDLDRSSFENDKQFERALSKTLKNIKVKFNGAIPTINNSGNGIHIILPIDCPILEQTILFEKYEGKGFFLSQEFLRFSERTLSGGKSDPGHYPSFRSCQIRLPNSINKKCLENREKRLSGNIKVKTIQRWNGIRAHISREFIEDFRTYLEGKITEQELDNDLLVNNHKQNKNKYDNDNIDWIEKLSLIGIEDHRKKAIDIIFVPYFILVKKLSNEETISKINEWLQKCNSIRTLDFDTKYRINTAIKNTNKKQILPMKFNTLKNNYQYLYSLIQNKGVII